MCVSNIESHQRDPGPQQLVLFCTKHHALLVYTNTHTARDYSCTQDINHKGGQATSGICMNTISGGNLQKQHKHCTHSDSALKGHYHSLALFLSSTQRLILWVYKDIRHPHGGFFTSGAALDPLNEVLILFIEIRTTIKDLIGNSIQKEIFQ